MSLVLTVALGAVSPGNADVVDQSSVVSANPSDLTPDVLDGKVRQTASVGGVTVAVGDFSQVRSAGSSVALARTDIFAFDSAGQVSKTFVPTIAGTEVYDVVATGDGKTVLIAGAFTSVNGAYRTGRIAKLDVTTGAVVATFKAPMLNNRVTDIELVGGRLFAGGQFTTVNGAPHTLLVELDPTTGGDTGRLHLTFADTWNGGFLGVTHLSVAADGSRMVVVGNFRTVNGQSRPQIAMVDLTTPVYGLSSWATARYGSACDPHFTTYVSDVDVDPSSTYFVVGTTGAYSGGPGSGSLCDTVARWELARDGGGQQPTWVDYTGGDTVWQVEAAGDVVYVGGHFRWLNNPYANDAVGPGGISRKGLAAVDPRNGMPTTWNPGRKRGWGVWGFRTAADGLWVGHDTDMLGGEPRMRLAFLPLAGGFPMPQDSTGSLPGSVYVLGGPDPDPAASTVLYRVNAGGPTLVSTDGGPDWTGDTGAAPAPFHNSGSVAASWCQAFGRSASVPSSVPQAVFSTERADPGSQPEMSWHFPVTVGTPVEVHLLFANGCSCTRQPGSRKFDVRLDGQLVLDDYDVTAAAGDAVGVMRSFPLTSDGSVDLDFSHVVENPMVSGIEIVRTDVTAGYSPDEAVRRIDYSGSSVSAVTSPTSVTLTADWRQARGAFMVDDVLYTPWSDGTLKARTWLGSRFTLPRTVNTYGLYAFGVEMASARAVFYDRSLGRLYFTRAGDGQLYYRYFLPQSSLVGGIRFSGPASVPGVDWGTIRGAFLAGDTLYVTTSTGALRAVGWANGAPTGAVTTVSGPGVDDVDWRGRALFLFSG